MTTTYNTLSTPEELLQAYTSLFLFLGGSVSMTPGESDLSHLCDVGLLRNLPVSSTNTRFARAVRLLRSPCQLKQHCHNAVGDNYHSLLSGSSTAEAYPASSNWIKSDRPAEVHYEELSALYRRYGYIYGDQSGMAPDHLGIQLLFTNLMLEKYLTEDDYEIRAMIGNDLTRFIREEMLNWLPRWTEAVTEKSRTKCYTGISDLIVGGLEDVLDILEGQKLGL